MNTDPAITEPPSEEDLLALAAAYLHCQEREKDKNEGLKQAEIAQRLKKTQPHVSRLLAHAKKRGWLRTKPQLGTIPPGWLDLGKDRYLALKGLKEHVSSWEIKEHVRAWGIPIECEPVVFSGSASNFYRQAAAHVAEVLQTSEVVGVTWGRTLAEVIRCLEEEIDVEKIADERPFRCIPISGEPLLLERPDRNRRYHSNELAWQLQKQMTGKDPRDMPLLHGVPAYLPKRFFVKALREFIATIPGYYEVFGTPTKSSGALIESVDTILTGVGLVGADDSMIGTFARERILQEKGEFTRDDFHRWVFGDIAGILLPRENLDPLEAKSIQGMNDRWIGTKREHLEECVKRSFQSGRPGVIVIAFGPSSKAELVQQVVINGLANRLILHEDLAKALLKLN